MSGRDEAVPAPPPDPGLARRLRRMRTFATALLAAMAAVFAAATWYLPPTGWTGAVRAFAEAALVGGLADWFAVTALFRRPLGLPIPHTAIVPRAKTTSAARSRASSATTSSFARPSSAASRARTSRLGSAPGSRTTRTPRASART